MAERDTGCTGDGIGAVFALRPKPCDRITLLYQWAPPSKGWIPPSKYMGEIVGSIPAGAIAILGHLAYVPYAPSFLIPRKNYFLFNSDCICI